MEYDLYHDESKEAGYWHGILLVPRDTRATLLRKLNEIRINLRHQDNITFKGLNSKGRNYLIIKAWLVLACCSLIQRQKGTSLNYYTGKIHLGPQKKQIAIAPFSPLIKSKFILFRLKNNHCDFNADYFRDYGSKIETSFRIGLKGGLNYLSDTNNQIVIKSFHFDGYEHYRRRVDLNRIVQRIGILNHDCCISQDVNIDDRTGNHKKNNCQNYDDCQLLQLTDLLVSGFRTIYGECKNSLQYEVARPLKDLKDRWGEGKKRMQNSRYYKGYCFSEGYIQNSEWKFNSNIQLDQDEKNDLFSDI